MRCLARMWQAQGERPACRTRTRISRFRRVAIMAWPLRMPCPPSPPSSASQIHARLTSAYRRCRRRRAQGPPEDGRGGRAGQAAPTGQVDQAPGDRGDRGPVRQEQRAAHPRPPRRSNDQQASGAGEWNHSLQPGRGRRSGPGGIDGVRRSVLVGGASNLIHPFGSSSSVSCGVNSVSQIPHTIGPAARTALKTQIFRPHLQTHGGVAGFFADPPAISTAPVPAPPDGGTAALHQPRDLERVRARNSAHAP